MTPLVQISARPRHHRVFPTLLGIAASIFLAGWIGSAHANAADATPSPRATRPPNIVFILADDLGYGDLGCYGQQRIHTPNIDRLAAEGVIFTQFYAGNTVCTPSRCALMTGFHVGHCSMRANGDEVNGFHSPTVATLLKQAGYDTAIIGKWGLADTGWPGVPNKQGFDFFFGYLNNMHAHNYYPTFLWRNDRKEPLKNVVPNEGASGQGVATVKVEYSADICAVEATEYIEGRKDKTKPFFLYLPFTIPHANDEAKNEGMEVPDLGEYEHKDWPAPEKGFAAMVTRLDRYVGEIRKQLQRSGLDDNTLVIFTSDNGPHKEGGQDPAFFKSWGKLRGMKRDLTEGGIREPMIVYWPGHTHAGTTCDYIGGFQDFLPTALAFAGAPAAAKTDGLNFIPAIEGRMDAQPKHDYLYWEFYERKGAQAVRQGDWKAIRTPAFTGKVALFDLKSDLHEDHDVAADHPEVVMKMEQIMQEAHTPREVPKKP